MQNNVQTKTLTLATPVTFDFRVVGNSSQPEIALPEKFTLGQLGHKADTVGTPEFHSALQSQLTDWALSKYEVHFNPITDEHLGVTAPVNQVKLELYLQANMSKPVREKIVNIAELLDDTDFENDAPTLMQVYEDDLFYTLLRGAERWSSTQVSYQGIIH